MDTGRETMSVSGDLMDLGDVESLEEGVALEGLSTLGVVRPLRCPRTAIPLAHLSRGPYPGQVSPFFEHLIHLGSDRSHLILRRTHVEQS